MRVELIFYRNNLNMDAGEIQKTIVSRLKKVDFPFKAEIVSVTNMAKYLVIIADFTFDKERYGIPYNRLADFIIYCISALAGLIVELFADYGVRYKTYEIHKLTSSLLFKEDWRTQKVALCVIAKDEAPYIGEFLDPLKSLPYFDDIVVGVDTRTKDSTWDEAVRHGARAFYVTWKDDFSKLRNETMQYVAPEIDWVFWLDVDEKPSEELLENIRSVVKTEKYDAYAFRLINLVTKTEEKGKIRLFRRSKGKWEGAVHEVVRGIPPERICHTDFKIYHLQRWMTMDEKTIKERNAFYRRLEALNDKKGGL